MSEIQKSDSISKAMISQDQIELIKRTICKGATNDELQMFLHIANKTGLDPFIKQIYAIKRWDSKEQKEIMGVQVSIDGARLIAVRSGKYEGQVGPLWCGKDGIWKDVWLEDGPPMAAKIGVLRRGFREPIFGVAVFASYVATTKEGRPTTMWQKLPDVMIAKCAESLALRKAFPAELCGLHTEEEMEQSDDLIRENLSKQAIPAPVASMTPVSSPKPESAKARTRQTVGVEIMKAGDQLKMSKVEIENWAKEVAKVEDVSKMTLQNMEDFLNLLQHELGRNIPTEGDVP